MGGFFHAVFRHSVATNERKDEQKTGYALQFLAIFSVSARVI
jgi:hypothetical protein